MRLNEKLIEKDHEEFERVESRDTPHGSHQTMAMDLEYFKKETKLLREQVLGKCEEIDSLQSTKECMSETIKILKLELVKNHNKSENASRVT